MHTALINDKAVFEGRGDPLPTVKFTLKYIYISVGEKIIKYYIQMCTLRKRSRRATD